MLFRSDILQSYLGRADRQISRRMNRMAQARERLNKNYEIYDADLPGHPTVERFTADTPEQAKEYYYDYIKNYVSDRDYTLELRRGTGLLESQSYMAGHCHVMAIALKMQHPNWQIRAHIGWEEEAEDEDDYRIDHIYIVAPDGSAYDCRGKFNNETELVGPNETGVETQYIDYSLDDMKADVLRGELKSFNSRDIDRAVKFAQRILKEEYLGPNAIKTPGLNDALADWSEMYETVKSVDIILSSAEAEPFKKPPTNILALYRAIVPKDRETNQIKSGGKIVAFATDINGAHQFIETLDIEDRYVIIKKQFHPQDFVLDFTSFFETYDYGSLNQRYVSEHEVWMKNTPYYNSVSQDEIVYDSKIVDNNQ